MNVHPPSVGVLPQPGQYNVLNTQRLQDLWFHESSSVSRSDSNAEFALLRCEICRKRLHLHDGYLFLDEFFCDACAAPLLGLIGGAYAN